MLCVALVLGLLAPSTAWVANQPLAGPRSVTRRASAVEMAPKKSKAEERRISKLITGTNFPPRTMPTPGEGYLFFQGPTPKTAVQKDLPPFFSAENFAAAEVSGTGLAVTAVGFAAAAALA